MARKLRNHPPPTIGFISLGCAKNLVDSEIMAARLLAAGWRLAPAPERAGLVIVNTCCFIAAAKREAIAAILEACAWKRRGPCRVVLVAGCLPQRYQAELPAALPEVDGWIGLDEISRVEDVVRRLAGGARGIFEVSAVARAVIEPPACRPLFTGAPYAYLKIAEGCHHHCRYCVIPRIRGGYRSRPLKRILAEAENLLGQGIRELNLISQDVTAYGRDLGGNADVSRLLRALGKIGGKFWLRLLYAHPARISDALLETMGTVPQVCHYLDIPIQHSHPAMLKAMGRPAVPGGLEHLLRRARAVLPDLVLRTTCLVGFPGETEAHFRHLLEFVAAARFDHLGAFAYSREEGTPAADLPAQVPPRIAERRRQRLMRLQQRIVFQRNAGRVGMPAEILIEKPAARPQYVRGGCGTADGELWQGRSCGEAPEVDGTIFVAARTGSLKPGMFAAVRYTAAAGYDLRAVAERASGEKVSGRKSKVTGRK
jgi:ribosomal protein S12 methylthiotransferase